MTYVEKRIEDTRTILEWVTEMLANSEDVWMEPATESAFLRLATEVGLPAEPTAGYLCAQLGHAEGEREPVRSRGVPTGEFHYSNVHDGQESYRAYGLRCSRCGVHLRWEEIPGTRVPLSTDTRTVTGSGMP